jgi:hypothetical protein
VGTRRELEPLGEGGPLVIVDVEVVRVAHVRAEPPGNLPTVPVLRGAGKSEVRDGSRRSKSEVMHCVQAS